MENKHIIILGGGAREVAICRSLLKTKNLNILYYADQENIQLTKLCGNNSYYHSEEFDNLTLETFNFKINYIVVGQEKYFLNKNLLKLEKLGIPIIGPTQSCKLELSKHYTRIIVGLKEHSFNPRYEVLYDNNDKFTFTNDNLNNNNSFVIKPDGLTGGKGVKLFPEHFTNNDKQQNRVHFEQNIENTQDKIKFENNIIDVKTYQNAINYINNCKEVLIEEKLQGEEFSLMCFTDSHTLKFMPLVKDYKRAFEGDLGPNTGSMGSVCDNNLYFLNEEELSRCKKLMTDVILYMKEINKPYKGILYGSFMKTNDNELKLIEFNCRLGDPEAINVLQLLDTSLDQIFEYINNQNLHELDIKFNNMVNTLIYVVPKNYGLENKNLLIEPNQICLEHENLLNDKLYLASMKNNNNSLVPTSSRSYGLLFDGKNFNECQTKMNEYFNNNTLNTKIFRIRNDIVSSYLDKKNKYKYTSIAGINTNLVGDTLNELKKDIESTYNDNVKSEFGEFSGCFTIEDNILDNVLPNPLDDSRKLNLMASTDGVGSKILLLEKIFNHKGYYIAGQDLVNHNINDILVDGGHPLFFLDYFGCNQLNPENLKQFVKGCVTACKRYNISILGGETAIIKSIFKENTADLNGTIVGYKRYRFYPKLITKGDILVGIPSSGFHTNGFSLLQKYYTTNSSLIEGIKQPHRCYLDLIQKLINKNITIKTMSHITGGGFYDNLNRVIKVPYKLYDFKFPIYYKDLLQNISRDECINIFNCGYGLVLVVSKEEFTKIQNVEPNANIIGEILTNTL